MENRGMSALKKICIHWTAGDYTASRFERQFYHYLIPATGKVVSGKFAPAANIPPLVNGHYAAHCGGGNSYCIGVALCGMAGYVSPKNPGQYPLLKQQCESAWALVAKLCHEHDILVTPDTVFTHAEFGRQHPQSDSSGKIDITHLPYEPNLKADAVGDYIRQKIRWYLAKLGGSA
jgi:N-acetylmuramoyl-L-alanine amidase